MPFQRPPPWSTGPRIPALDSAGRKPQTTAPFHPAPGSTGGSPRTPALFQPGGMPRIPVALSAQSAPLGCTAGMPRIPVSLSAQSAPLVSNKFTVLVDWWLERVEGEEGKIRVVGDTYTPRNGESSSRGNRKGAGRVFKSNAIVKRHDFTMIESEDGFRIQLHCLNIPETLKNGFSKEVCECFEFGFPIPWQRLVNPNMVLDNEHPSETATSEPSHSVQYYMDKFSSDDFANSYRYKDDPAEKHLYWFPANGHITQSLSNLPDDNAGNITASWGLHGLRMDVPEKPLAPPGEACNNSQESDQHESTQIDACKQELVNRSISSVSVKQSTGSISPNSKVDGSILAPSKIMSVVNGSYRSTVGCGQAGEDARIQQESMHSCSSEHGMVTLPIDCMPSQLGESGILKSRKDSVSLGTTDALELPTEGMTPKFGAIEGSEHSTGRRLRSGKVLGMPSGGPIKRGYKQKKIQLEASSKQMVDQGATSTADLTSHENDFSAAEVAVEEKLESHDSCRRGRGRPPNGEGKGKRKRKRKSTSFWNRV